MAAGAQHTRVRTLECACSNKGVVIYEIGDSMPYFCRLIDLGGEFRRGSGDDPAISCCRCGRMIRTENPQRFTSYGVAKP